GGADLQVGEAGPTPTWRSALLCPAIAPHPTAGPISEGRLRIRAGTRVGIGRSYSYSQSTPRGWFDNGGMAMLGRASVDPRAAEERAVRRGSYERAREHHSPGLLERGYAGGWFDGAAGSPCRHRCPRRAVGEGDTEDGRNAGRRMARA